MEKEKLEYYFKPETLSKFDEGQKEVLELIINTRNLNKDHLKIAADVRYSAIQMFQIYLALKKDDNIDNLFYIRPKYPLQEIRATRKDIENIERIKMLQNIYDSLSKSHKIIESKLNDVYSEASKKW
ncbi:hypothetical protein ACXYRQ_02745 [Mycoplasma sp. 394]|uniref:hypothetical protein n=1 Tax=Mycoplasma sp. 6243 TaxID=3440865 RepID=UPI003EB99575